MTELGQQIEKARLAQQQNLQKHDVQLEIKGLPLNSEVGKINHETLRPKKKKKKKNTAG